MNVIERKKDFKSTKGRAASISKFFVNGTVILFYSRPDIDQRKSMFDVIYYLHSHAVLVCRPTFGFTTASIATGLNGIQNWALINDLRPYRNNILFFLDG